MNKRTGKWLFAGAILIVLGALLFAAAMTSLGWDFVKLSTVDYETNEYSFTPDFQDISVETDTAGIRFVPSEDGSCEVICYEEADSRHRVEVRDGCLFIQVTDTRAWYDHIGFRFGSPEIIVYLPAGSYGIITLEGHTGGVDIPHDYSFDTIDIGFSTGDISIGASAEETIRLGTDTGSIRLNKVSAGAMDITTSTGRIAASDLNCAGVLEVHVSTGKTELKNVRCESFRSTGSTGDLMMENVIAADIFFIRRSTGHVSFDGCDASQITVETDTGDVRGTLCSDKLFRVETDTGDILVPDSTSGGSCRITTSTGDIILETE